jgi:branched-chain amino acid transport system permease protein
MVKAVALFVMLALLPLLARALAIPDLITLATQAAIFGLAAASLNLLIGYTGLISFGHAAFFGLGGYIAAILAVNASSGGSFLGIPGTNLAWVAWPIAMAITAIAALLIGLLSLRTAGLQFIMITLAFAEMLFFLFVSLKTYGGDDGLGFRRRQLLPFIDPRDDIAFYQVSLAALAAFLGISQLFLRARFGMVLQGIRQNPIRLRAVGVPPAPYQLACFVIAGAGAGLAGALQANALRFVSPDMLHWTTSGDLMVMVVLGGTGTLLGPVIGAWAMIGLQSILGRWTEHWMIVLGPLLVLVVLFAPRGIWGSLTRRELAQPSKLP